MLAQAAVFFGNPARRCRQRSLLELGLGTNTVGARRLLRPPIKRMQSIVRVAENAPGKAVLAGELASQTVLRALVENKVLRGTLVYERSYTKRR